MSARCRIPITELQELSLPQAKALCKEFGRPISKAVLQKAIFKGYLPVKYDPFLIDNQGQPRMYIMRDDLERWLKNRFVPTETISKGKHHAQKR